MRPFPWQQIYNDALARQLDAALLPLNDFQKVRDLLVISVDRSSARLSACVRLGRLTWRTSRATT